MSHREQDRRRRGNDTSSWGTVKRVQEDLATSQHLTAQQLVHRCRVAAQQGVEVSGTSTCYDIVCNGTADELNSIYTHGELVASVHGTGDLILRNIQLHPPSFRPPVVTSRTLGKVVSLFPKLRSVSIHVSEGYNAPGAETVLQLAHPPALQRIELCLGRLANDLHVFSSSRMVSMLSGVRQLVLRRVSLREWTVLMSALCQSRKRMPELVSLHVWSNEYDLPGKAVWNELIPFLQQRSSKLIDLQVEAQAEVQFADALGKCVHLRRLHVNQLDQAETQSIGQLLPKLKKLKSLAILEAGKWQRAIGVAIPDIYTTCWLRQYLGPSHLGTLQNLRHLSLPRSVIADDDARDLSASLALMPKLEELDLSENVLSGAGMDMIFTQLVTMKRLVVLDVSGNRLDAAAESALMQRYQLMPQLKHATMPTTLHATQTLIRWSLDRLTQLENVNITLAAERCAADLEAKLTLLRQVKSLGVPIDQSRSIKQCASFVKSVLTSAPSPSGLEAVRLFMSPPVDQDASDDSLDPKDRSLVVTSDSLDAWYHYRDGEGDGEGGDDDGSVVDQRVDTSGILHGNAVLAELTRRIHCRHLTLLHTIELHDVLCHPLALELLLLEAWAGCPLLGSFKFKQRSSDPWFALPAVTMQLPFQLHIVMAYHHRHGRRRSYLPARTAPGRAPPVSLPSLLELAATSFLNGGGDDLSYQYSSVQQRVPAELQPIALLQRLKLCFKCRRYTATSRTQELQVPLRVPDGSLVRTIVKQYICCQCCEQLSLDKIIGSDDSDDGYFSSDEETDEEELDDDLDSDFDDEESLSD